MNDLTKGTTMQNSLWARENDWTKVQIFDTVRLTNDDGAEVTIVVSNRCEPSARPFAPWVESRTRFTYFERDWRLFVQVPLRPVLPVLPKRPGTVIRAKDLVVVAMFSYASSGWFAVKNEPKMTDNELRKNFEGGFDVLEPVAETAKKVLDRVRAGDAFISGPYVETILSAIAAEFEVTS